MKSDNTVSNAVVCYITTDGASPLVVGGTYQNSGEWEFVTCSGIVPNDATMIGFQAGRVESTANAPAYFNSAVCYVMQCPTSWSFGGETGQSVAREEGMIHNGSYSVRLANTNGYYSSFHSFVTPYASYLNQTVVFGAWVWASVPNIAFIDIYDGIAVTRAYHPGDSEWHFISCTQTISNSANQLRAEVGIGTTASVCFVDKIAMYVMTAPTGWTNNASTFWREESIVETGSYSLGMKWVTNGYMGQNIVSTTYPLSYWKLRTITASVWCYATDVGKALISINDGFGFTNTYHPGGGWKLLTVTRTISSSAVAVTIYLGIEATSTTLAYFSGTTVTDSVTGDVTIINPNFDRWPGLVPASWTLAGTNAGVSMSTQYVQDGVSSCRLLRSGTDCSFYQIVPANVYKGKGLYLGAWVWASVPGVARISISSDQDGLTTSDFHSGSSKWEWLSVEKLVSSAATSIIEYLEIVGVDTPVFFDGAISFISSTSTTAVSDRPADKQVASDGHVESVVIVNGGTGYSASTQVTIGCPPGGLVAYENEYTTRTFTADDVFTPTASGTMEVYAWGGGGGGGTVGGWVYGSQGGAGGFAYGMVSVTAGTRYKVVVGSGGLANAIGCAHGGGSPATNNNVDNRYCGGGGGLSGLFLNLYTQSNAILIAGGGGGGGSARSGTGNAGGGGGGTSGQMGFAPYPVTTDPLPTGGTITTDGLYTVHTFTSSGTFQPMVAGTVKVLVVGGGGGGASGQSGVNAGAGGGGGIVVYNAAYSVTTSPITVTVGNGGAGGTGNGSGGHNGTNSVFGSITATPGYGPSASSRTGGGNASYAGGTNNVYPNSGGGAGATSVGYGSNGGVGYTSDIRVALTPVQYGGGGGGSNSGTATGGGGTPNQSATANTGGGGGGGTDPGGNAHGGTGGTGVVIVRYLTSSQHTSGSYGGNPGTQVGAGADATRTGPYTASGLQGALQGGQVRINSYGGGGGGGYYGGSAGGYGETSTMGGGGGGSAYYNGSYVTLPTLISANGTIPGSVSNKYRGLAGSAGSIAGPGARGKVVIKYVTALMDVTTETPYSTSTRATALPTISAGVITAITVIDGGSGYYPDFNADTFNPYPPVTIYDPIGTGAGANAVCYVPEGLPQTPSGDVRHHHFTIMHSKTVKSWGYPENYDLVQGDANVSSYLPNNTGFVNSSPLAVIPIHVASGQNSSYVLDSLGRVWVGGFNTSYELGLGDTTNRSVYTMIPTAYFGNVPVVKVKAFWNSTMYAYAITADGNVYRWGYNNQGQLGTGNSNNVATPTILSSPFGILDISYMGASGYSGTMLLDSWGQVWVCGYNGYANLSDGTTTQRSTFQLYNTAAGTPLTGACRVWGGGADGSYIDSYVRCYDGRLYAAGYNANCQLGNGTTTSTQSATGYCSRVLKSDSSNFTCDKWWIQPGSTGGSTCSSYVRETGTELIYGFGYNGQGELGLGDTSSHSTATVISQLTGLRGTARVLDIAVGHGSDNSYTACLFSDGRVVSAGYNGNGQLGDGTTTNRSSWVTTPCARRDVIKVRMAQVSSYGWIQVLCANGTLYTAGYNGNGELGDGQTNNRYTLGEVLF